MLFLGIYLTVELFAFTLYSLVKGQLFSFSQYQSFRQAIIDSAASQHLPAEEGVLILRARVYQSLHPYLGYVLDPKQMTGISNYGFHGETPPISEKDDDTCVIGIFGGSFALGTARSGGETLIAVLKQSPRFANKDIILHTLAFGGYKQPQQLLALTYLLSLGAHFDIIINLDGFNEVALPPRENIPKKVFPFYPRNWFRMMYNFHDTSMLTMAGEIALLTEKQKKWARALTTVPLRYSIVCNILWEYYNKRLSNEKAEKERIFQQYTVSKKEDIGYTVTGPPFHYGSDPELYNALVDVWKTSSRQMHRLSTANGIVYFHFLQPSQYVPGSKVMRKEERKIAFKENHPYRQGVEKGYPYLRKAGRDLMNEGVRFYDFTMIFVDNDEVLYRDPCCHVNRKGYKIISTAIGQAIVKYLETR